MKAMKLFTVLGGVFVAIGTVFLGLGLFFGERSGYSEEMMGLWLSFIVLGGTFALIGVPFMIIGKVMDKSRLRRLMYTGERIEAKVIGVERAANIDVNGRNPWRVACAYTEDGVRYICYSEYYDYMPEVTADTVSVWRDRANHSKYYVDMEGAVTKTVVL